MRGTPRQTNKALFEPILFMGGERSLVILSVFFWLWMLSGVFPHWPSIITIIGLIATIYVLRFAAKRDPKGVAIFRKNSRFLVQKRFYLAHGFAANLSKTRRVRTVPIKLTARF